MKKMEGKNKRQNEIKKLKKKRIRFFEYNIFIKLQFSTNIMANEVKTPIQNYFEKVLYENLTLLLSSDQNLSKINNHLYMY
jgi:hypothetical protein